MKEIETISSRVAYKNNWMTVREDKVLRPSGAEGIYGVVDKPDFVAILPIQSNYIHLVEQYRYPVEGRYWEIPQGSWDCLLYTSPSPRDLSTSRMPSSA